MVQYDGKLHMAEGGGEMRTEQMGPCGGEWQRAS